VKHKYDIIVVGGGHAGAEASLAAARLGNKTLLITLNKNGISKMSCNPAIGGLAKGHLVAEIDALGGEMGKLIDKTGLQFKILNKSKGRAVWSPRAQADKIQYSKTMSETVTSQNNLDVLEDMAIKINVANHVISSIDTEKNGTISCKSLILTCGTFLNGKMFIGDNVYEGGRWGERKSYGLTESLNNHGIESGRLKTGTPPRIHKDSINFSEMTPQHGDPDPKPFSFQTTNFAPPNIPCYITKTNPETHKIIYNVLDISPLFTGAIVGSGPRYCPSIELKLIRFKEKHSHLLFVEPEWLNSNQYYINGYPTSIPLDAQLKSIRTVPGLKNAEFIQAGYAIEYDYFPSRQLYRTLETKKIQNLYLAGQINGTSGYEEAAALGLIAGINASQKINKKEPFILERSESYIGVLIDDLITKNPTEPYRMFTSRAEYRLLLRFDNADRRLSTKGYNLGLLPKQAYEKVVIKNQVINKTINHIRSTFYSPDKINDILINKQENPVKSGVSLDKIIKRQNIHFSDIINILPNNLISEINQSASIKEQIDIDIKYEGYIKRNLDLIESVKNHEHYKIPKNIQFSDIQTITHEAREKLDLIKPETLGQASRISGVSPADITSLMIYLKRK